MLDIPLLLRKACVKISILSIFFWKSLRCGPLCCRGRIKGRDMPVSWFNTAGAAPYKPTPGTARSPWVGASEPSQEPENADSLRVSYRPVPVFTMRSVGHSTQGQPCRHCQQILQRLPAFAGQHVDGTGPDQLLQRLGHRGLLDPPQRHQLGLG